MNLQRRVEALERRRFYADLERIAAPYGLSAAYVAAEMRKYLDDPRSSRVDMSAVEATLTDAQKTELAVMKVKWRRLLRTRREA